MIAALNMDLLARRKMAQQQTETKRRSFAGAQQNRLTADWSGNGISLDSILVRDLPILRERAREMARNNEYFQKFLTMLRSNIVGSDGIQLRNKAQDPPTFKDGKLTPGPLDVLANKLVEDAWWDWGKKENCTISKNINFVEAQWLSIEEVGTTGATIWRKVRGAEARNRFNFALQPIAIDRVDLTKNQKLENGNVIRMGMEFNQNGEHVGVWLFDSDPTDFYFGYGNSYSSHRYNARDFVHCYLMRRIGQSQGYPWAAASMLRSRMLQGFDEAHLEGARAAACKMGFLTKTAEAGGGSYTGENVEGGGKYMDAEPGMLEELPIGMDVKTVDWKFPSPEYAGFTKACLRGMAAGWNVSYPTLANDYAEVNFSSGRMAQLEERDFWKFGQSWFISHYHDEIFPDWLEESLAAGAIALELPSGDRKPLPPSKHRKFNAPTWRGRRWTWVDPSNEIKAKVAEIRAGLTTPTKALLELGEDPAEVLDEIAEFKAEAEKRGLKFPDLFDEHKSDATAPQSENADTDGLTPEQFKSLVDGYGVGVRAGVITPNESDEEFFRGKLGLEMNEAVTGAWEEDDGVRRPITLQVKGGGSPMAVAAPTEPSAENE